MAEVFIGASIDPWNKAAIPHGASVQFILPQSATQHIVQHRIHVKLQRLPGKSVQEVVVGWNAGDALVMVVLEDRVEMFTGYVATAHIAGEQTFVVDSASALDAVVSTPAGALRAH